MATPQQNIFFQNEKVQCSHIWVYKQFEGSINNRFIKRFWFSWLTSKIKKYLLLCVKGSRVKPFQIFSLTVNKMSFYAKCTPRLGTFSSRQIYNNNKSKKENIMISCVQINCTRKLNCTHPREHCDYKQMARKLKKKQTLQNLLWWVKYFSLHSPKTMFFYPISQFS